MAMWRPDPWHRYPDQLRFVARFPAYTTSVSGQTLTWWYREGEEVAAMRFHPYPADGPLLVEGAHIARAERAMRLHLEPLPDDLPRKLGSDAHRRLYERFSGIRPVLALNAFEGLVWAILGQQINVAFAVRLKEAMARRWGTVIETPSGTVAIFPSPGQLARVGIEDMRALQLSGQKAKTISGLAGQIADGGWNLDQFYQLPTAQARQALITVHGIGPWTADYALLRVFGHPDVIPVADVGLRRAWARAVGCDGVTPAELDIAAEAWSGHRSEFAFWLWLSNLDDDIARVGHGPPRR